MAMSAFAGEDNESAEGPQTEVGAESSSISQEFARLSNDAHRSSRPSIVSTALVDDFARTLYKISSSLGEMREMSDALGGPNDSHDHRAKLNALTEVTKEMIMHSNMDLRYIGQQDTLSEVERVRLTKMTRNFQRLMQRFQDIQKTSLEKCRDFVIRAQAIARDSVHTSPLETTNVVVEGGMMVPGEGDPQEEQNREETDNDTAPLFTENPQRREELVSLQNEISYNQALIQEREQGIQEIETAMAEVHEIFCDLGLLVGEQQGLLDNIEANIEASAVRTRAAHQELLVARDYQRRKRGNLCFILLVVAILFIMALAIINALL